jgi:hypothetical protein
VLGEITLKRKHADARSHRRTYVFICVSNLNAYQPRV